MTEVFDRLRDCESQLRLIHMGTGYVKKASEYAHEARVSLRELERWIIKEIHMKNDPNHIGDKHPFEISGKNGGRSYVKFSHTMGIDARPGGGGDKISANAAMKKKRPLNGPGVAR